MAIFEYQARTKEGNVQTGSVEATDEAAALEILQKNNLFVIAVQSPKDKRLYMRQVAIFNRVKGKDLAIFFRQLSALFKAAVPLVSALDSLAEQTKNIKLADATREISANVDGGMPLYKAMEEHTNIFGNFSVQLVRAGEESGAMSQVLLYLAEYTERDYRIKAKIKSAMTYPAFVFGVFVLVGILMMVFVVPRLLVVISETGAAMPFVTQVISDISNFFRHRWYIALGGTFLMVFGAYRFLKSDFGGELWDKWQLKLPIIGKIFRNIYLFRFAESLGMLVKGGVPIDSSLKITADVIDNSVYRQIVNEAREKVNKGERIAATLEKYPQMQGLVTSMIAVGEQTGTLESVLEISSNFYTQEVETSIEALSALIEPILIVFMAIGVGFLIAGVLLPMYGIIAEL
jgi:type IV pilus assembly protein PilC